MARTVPGLKKRPVPRSAFKKGMPRPANAGRKKGTPNKFSGELKQLVLDALANAKARGQKTVGAQPYLENQAKVNPKTFLALISKLLPTQVTGKDGGPIDLMVSKAQINLASLSAKELTQLQALLAKAGLTEIGL